jgi:hypothetical protein
VDAADVALALEIAAMAPWLRADPGSWWIATGRTGDGLVFRDATLRCLPESIAGPGVRVFEGLPCGAAYGMGFHATAADITAAREVMFVYAADPLRALDRTDQDVIDAALRDREVG